MGFVTLENVRSPLPIGDYSSNQFQYTHTLEVNNASSLAQLISSSSVYVKATGKVIDLSSIPLSVEDLRFEDYSQVDSSVLSFNLSPFSHLKSVTIGDDSFGSPIEFIANELNELISIDIGMNSFTRSRMSCAERWNREFHVKNCGCLRELIIGRYSFSDYCVFDLSNLPQLRTISIGTVDRSNNFYYAYDVDLIDLPSLESISIGRYSFGGCHSVRFENLTCFQSMYLFEGAFYGDWRDDRKSNSTAPFNYRNILTMKNLSLLVSMRIPSICFRYIGSVVLENIPVLSSGIITSSGNYQFESVYELNATNAVALESFIRSRSSYV
ncbi:hypothetical protein WA171_002336 [Blastocystis sp. BT1]